MATKSALKSAEAGSTNARGIPVAPFVDNVSDYVSTRADVEPTLKSFQEMISKYQFMEASNRRRLGGLQEKIPDIQKTLDTVRFLRRGAGGAASDDADDAGDLEGERGGDQLETLFELNDTLYAKASIPRTPREVCLWLGANVMLSYPIEEAEALLVEKLDGAQKKKEECEEDIDFLREQITTMEVATARVYNWDVGQRRKERAEGTERGKDG